MVILGVFFNPKDSVRLQSASMEHHTVHAQHEGKAPNTNKTRTGVARLLQELWQHQILKGQLTFAAGTTPQDRDSAPGGHFPRNSTLLQRGWIHGCPTQPLSFAPAPTMSSWLCSAHSNKTCAPASQVLLGVWSLRELGHSNTSLGCDSTQESISPQISIERGVGHTGTVQNLPAAKGSATAASHLTANASHKAFPSKQLEHSSVELGFH